MGSEPGNGVLPTVYPLPSTDASDLPQSIRSNIEAIGSITGLHNQQVSITQEK